MEFLLFLIIGVGVYYLGKNAGSANGSNAEEQLAARNRDWITFIKSYHGKAKTKAGREVIEQMVADLDARYGTATALDAAQTAEPAPGQVAATAVVAGAAVTTAPALKPAPAHRSVQLDNATLLLYFGAFLFVAATGLFVAFGGMTGGLRTFTVLFVTITMYLSGLWLWRNKPSLKLAGVSFIGIGLSLAPLCGVAAYAYLFDQSQAPLVWLATSIFCLGLYGHALYAVRAPLLGYVFLGTLLSLFESAVSIIDAPVYYYGWAMAAVGLLFVVASHFGKAPADLDEPSRRSADLFLPVALLISLVVVQQEGASQLGVSLLLAAAYYTLRALWGSSAVRLSSAAAAQVAAISGVALLVFGVDQSYYLLAQTLVALVVVQAVTLVCYARASELWSNAGTITLVSGIAALGFSLDYPGLLVAALGFTTATGVSLWLRQKRSDAYLYAAVLWMLLPIAIGQGLMQPHLGPLAQVSFMFGALVVQLAVYAYCLMRADMGTWRHTAKAAYMLSVAIVMLGGLVASPLACFGAALAVCATIALLAHLDDTTDWPMLAGFIVLLPIARGANDPDVMLASTFAALLVNIGLALWRKADVNRWLSTLLWLLVPIALAPVVGDRWSMTYYGYSYLAITIVLVLSRCIALGMFGFAANVPLMRYARTASLSYVYGYVAAAVLAVGTSFFITYGSLVHTTIILAAITGLTVALGLWVERRPVLFMAATLLVQAVLLSGLAPSVDGSGIVWYLSLSLLLAISTYVLPILLAGSDNLRSQAMQQGSLLVASIAPLSVLWVGETRLPMPLGLLALAAMLYHNQRRSTQANRELIGGLAAIGVMWLLYFFGVRETQAYTHVLVALFAGYAYWRHKRGETDQRDQYLLALLATATVPLTLQALSGEGGGLYGWWLLLEQVAFMLLGMAISNKHMVRWGLYVAAGAVLYQLRDLGWAALAFLALFLIGIAVYRIQKLDKPQ